MYVLPAKILLFNPKNIWGKKIITILQQLTKIKTKVLSQIVYKTNQIQIKNIQLTETQNAYLDNMACIELEPFIGNRRIIKATTLI